MADSFECDVQHISTVLENEILKPYAKEVEEANKKGIQKTMKQVVKETKAAKFDHAYPTAGRAPGTFTSHISHKGEAVGTDGWKETWYVRPPEYRLAHLLANGHETRSGGRSKSNPFIADAAANAEKNVIDNIKKELGE